MSGSAFEEPVGAAAPPLGHPWTAVDVLVRVLGGVGGARPAVTDLDATLSGAELLDRGARGALALLDALGTLPEEAPVGVLAPTGVESVAAAVAVLMSGRPLVLVDPELPQARAAAVLASAGARAVVLGGGLPLPGARAGSPVLQAVSLERLWGPRPGERDDALAEWTERRPAATRSSRALAALVVTSGSTGEPKAVRLSHALLVHGATTAADLLATGPGKRLALAVPPAFAMGLTVLVTGLLSGAELHVVDPRARGTAALVELLREHRVEATWLTPSLLRALSQGAPEGGLPDLRLVACGGEALSSDVVRAARGRLGEHLTVVNVLGSSETWHTAAEVLAPGDPVPVGVVPAGRALPGAVLEAVDDDGVVLPHGTTGVLRVRASVLADGYVGLPSDAFGTSPGGWSTYRTGDLARTAPGGRVELRGRADDAVKVRGYLVEPLEVQTALAGLDGVDEAAVVARPGPAGQRLVAYAAVGSAERPPSAAHVRRGLREVLPSWMVPDEVVLLESLPRTERGKVDRARLPEPQRPPHEPPRGELEESVAALWAGVLGRLDLGRHDSFVSAGGDSLAVEELLTRLDAELGVRLTSSHLAEAPTVAEFAALVAQLRVADGRPHRGPVGHGSVAVLRRADGEEATTVLCFAGAGASAQSFLPLAERLGPGHRVVAFQQHGMEERTLPDLSLRMAAHRHLKDVRAVQPEGPYHLVGHSMGGLVALEVGQLLLLAGQQVASVTLLDTYFPPGPARQVRELVQGLLTGPWSTRGRQAAPSDDSPCGAEDGGLWRKRSAALAAGLAVGRGRASTEQQKELAVRVAALHRPRPWHGSAVLVRSHENPDPEDRWDEVLVGPRRVVTIDGGHNALLRDPYVESIAEVVGEELRAGAGPAADRVVAG